jgi:hypothetical protein
LVTATLALATFAGGCTTFLYKGPSRPSAEIATVISNDTIVDKVDDVAVRERTSGTYARLELLPGPHRLGISLNRVTAGFFVTNVARSGIYFACVTLQAGHTYKTVPDAGGYRFAAKVVDMTTGFYVDTRCWNGRPPAAVQAGSPPVAPPAGEAPVATAVDAPGAPTEAAGATAGEAAPPAAAARDAEEPAAEQVPSQVPSINRTATRARLASDAQLSDRHPGSGLSLFFGFALGGEDFVQAMDSNGNTQTLSSGSGAIAGLGLMLTPAWAGDSVGFGFGLDGAIKYDHLGASNGDASITRYPVALTAHALFNVSDAVHYIIVKGGVSRDFGVNYSTSGFATIDANVSGTWGPTGAIGYFKRTNDVFGWDILGIFALEKHTVGTAQINANSFGLTMGIHWRP